MKSDQFAELVASDELSAKMKLSFEGPALSSVRIYEQIIIADRNQC